MSLDCVLPGMSGLRPVGSKYFLFGGWFFVKESFIPAGKSQKIASAAAAVLSKFNAHMRPCSASTRRALPALQMLVQQQQQADARAATSPRTNQMTEITTNVYSSYPLTRPTDRPNDPSKDQYESISLVGCRTNWMIDLTINLL